ncbi:hypothetical protein GF351_00065 [Candidatus Woesearchaeota archaeon]|nr:hypothetical protein [Candidatus Woesearchaeota archaeon]
MAKKQDFMKDIERLARQQPSGSGNIKNQAKTPSSAVQQPRQRSTIYKVVKYGLVLGGIGAGLIFADSCVRESMGAEAGYMQKSQYRSICEAVEQLQQVPGQEISGLDSYIGQQH